MTSFDLDLSKYNLGWSDDVEYAFTPEKGLNQGVVDQDRKSTRLNSSHII